MNINNQTYFKATLSLILTLIVAYAFFSNVFTLITPIFVLPFLILLLSILGVLDSVDNRFLVTSIFVFFIFHFFVVRFLNSNTLIVVTTMIVFLCNLMIMFITNFNFLKQE
ncbi:MAG: hypothetical protein ACRCXZ_04525 [Patescibacteria group bacterium]